MTLAVVPGIRCPLPARVRVVFSCLSSEVDGVPLVLHRSTARPGLHTEYPLDIFYLVDLVYKVFVLSGLDHSSSILKTW